MKPSSAPKKEAGLLKQDPGGGNKGVLLPPLWDHHGHLCPLGTISEELDLRDAASSLSLLKTLKREASRRERGEWLLGFGWDHNRWGGKLPGLEEIDEATGDKPLFIRRIDCHAALVNSAALILAGAKICSGNLKPLAVDSGMTPFFKAIPPPGKETIRKRFLKAFAILRSYCLSGATDMQLGKNEIAVLSDMDREGTLDFPVLGYKEWRAGDKFPGRLYRGRKFILKGLKVFIDGALGSRGAALREPYSDEKGNTGILLLDRKDILALLQEANARKFDVAFHAIGDMAFEEFLAAFEKVRGQRIGVRIEHMQVTPADLLGRLRGMNVTVSLQPCHYLSDRSWAKKRLGAGRIGSSYLLKSLMEGKKYLFGTDFPIESPDPLRTIAACLSRPGKERPGFKEILKGMSCPEEFNKYGVRVKAMGAAEQDAGNPEDVLSWKLAFNG
jgi:predicted amidohydrolase YtcJ